MTRSAVLTIPIGALCVVALIVMPLGMNDYLVHVAALIGIYWILVSGLDLVVGYAGQLAVGYVGLLAVGAYTASILTNNLQWSPFAAAAAAMPAGALFGFIIGLPSLRLKHFYFAMTTLGFELIITHVALAWGSLTGGGTGLPGPYFQGWFSGQKGLYYIVLASAVVATYLVWNLARSDFGRALIAIRDAEVAAEALGIPATRVKLEVFVFSGALAGWAGALFAAAQSYITPDAFTLDLSILFFIAVLIGGRGRILGPLIGTIVLGLLPEVAAPLVRWSTFVYACLLLVVVLIAPGGISEIIERLRLRDASPHDIEPLALGQLDGLLGDSSQKPAQTLSLQRVRRRFGGLMAVDGVTLEVAAGSVHGLIGPNGSGKTTTLNIISGYYPPDEGEVAVGAADITRAGVARRAHFGLGRTFQTPRIVDEMSVVENVMLGFYLNRRVGFARTMFGSLAKRREEGAERGRALKALSAVGLGAIADRRADQLQHGEQRFLEIARCLAMNPAFILLDEPAAGLSHDEIEKLKRLILAIRERGVGILLIEHHMDLVFEVADAVTVLDLGRVVAQDAPQAIRTNREVAHAFLGE